MTKTDILISKDQEIKRLNDEITNLKEKINNLNISIGSKDEMLKSKVKELEKELELAKNEQRVIIRSTSNTGKKYICRHCGYETDNMRSYCPRCGDSGTLVVNNKATNDVYKNLDVELAEIKKSVEKEIKKTISSLEDTQLELEIKIETLENEGKRNARRHNAEIEDLQSKNLDRINKYKEQVQELKDE